jgi:hypothetical protein
MAGRSSCYTVFPTTSGVAPSLAAAGWRVLIPYLRGYGPTRFLDAATPRSGQQATLGSDLADFMGRARDRAGDLRRVRLGRARRLHRFDHILRE